MGFDAHPVKEDVNERRELLFLTAVIAVMVTIGSAGVAPVVDLENDVDFPCRFCFFFSICCQ